MEIQENILLAPLTTFKIGGPAEYFCAPKNQAEINEALDFARANNLQTFVLGGGSNMLISDAGIPGLVIHPVPTGISVIDQDGTSVTLDMAAGENWDEFVQYAISNGWWGIENLSYVPGSCGAFAVQNVGAYGQEASEVVLQVEAFDTQTREMKTILNEQCGFYYRHSIFNTTEKGKYIILNTRLKLSKIPAPNLKYPDLAKRFAGEPNPSLTKIRDAVIEIRNRKYAFPTTAEGGNAGSFFQNPLLDESQTEHLRHQIRSNFSAEVYKRFEAEVAKFQSRKTGLKIAAFLLDICGLKGTSLGGVKINENQPLVVLNKGTGTSEDVMKLAQLVRRQVFAKTGVMVPIEPELVGFSPAELDQFLAI